MVEKKKSFLGIQHLETQEINRLLDFAQEIKELSNSGKKVNASLRGKRIVNLF